MKFLRNHFKGNEAAPEVKNEIKPIEKKIDESINFLSSCTSPRNSEIASVMDFDINKSKIKYPVIIRELKEPLDLKYIVQSLVKVSSNDFILLKGCSKFSRSKILESIRIKPDEEADIFLENHVKYSNSFNSLKMLLGYDLIAPNKVERVEETKRFDEKSKRIFNVYGTDLRGKHDGLIIGAGIAISKYAGFDCKIDIIY